MAQHESILDAFSLLFPAGELLEPSRHPLENPIRYDESTFSALFPAESPARKAFEANPERIMLGTDDVLQAIPLWKDRIEASGAPINTVLLTRNLRYNE